MSDAQILELHDDNKPQFRAWPKIPRLYRDVTITEKIDGTNGCVIVSDPFAFGTHTDPGSIPDNATLGFGPDDDHTGLPDVEHLVSAQSRKRIITPSDDNFGFAQWVWGNAHALARALGPGYHFGEWWGSGIQRGYGFKDSERFFSLFNTGRWVPDNMQSLNIGGVDGLEVVPTLYEGPFTSLAVELALDNLRTHGSEVVPGFDRPEGVVVFHQAARQPFKVLLDSDHLSKGELDDDQPKDLVA